MSAVAPTSSAEILHHTSAFFSQTLSQPDLRRHLSSTFLQTLPTTLINPVEAIENAISTTTPSARSSSLRLAEKLLLSNSNSDAPFSSFLTSLVHYLSDRPIHAALSLLHVFQTDPSFSRLEMAPGLFQDLFLVHFAPFLECHHRRRSEITVSGSAVLSRISAYQASAMKDLERDFEGLLDQNCRILAQYFKQILRNKEGDQTVVPPTLLLLQNAEIEYKGGEDNVRSHLFASGNPRYNPMWDEANRSAKVKKGLSKYPSFIPLRVSPNQIQLETDTLTKTSSPPMDPPPPKDFVCPITTHLFHDPVTLETGQTYERRAIQEWLQRGNSTCPITRQTLHTNLIPKTNYVLKRLIATWRQRQQQNPSPAMMDDHPIIPSVSPNSVITQATSEGAMTNLRAAITELCTSEDLREAEMAVLRIEQLRKEGEMELEMLSMLAKPPVVSAFVEMLINSEDARVLRAAVVLLTELGSTDDGVVQTLTRVDSDVECIVQLFKKGLSEAVVLLHLLRPKAASLVEMDLVDYLLELLVSNEESDGLTRIGVGPETASLLLLAGILQSSIEARHIVESIVSNRAIERIIVSLKGEQVQERIAAVSILLRCILEEGKCRNMIAEKAEIAPLMEIFLVVNDGERFEILHFLSEIVKLNRRNVIEKILHVLKDEGSFNTMHTLLIYLQNAPPDQSPIVAGLLLQLDLLDEPRKMSIYREEAMDTLISCLKNTESPAAQISAAETILSLQGRFSYSGRSLSRAILLKRAGLDRSYRAFMRKDQRHQNISADVEAEKVGEEWERKVAFVVVSHEFGLVFEALAVGLKSNYEELHSVCFMTATWLIYMLSVLPDTGLRGAARVCLLNHLVSVFKSDKNAEDRALAVLGLNTFIRQPEGLQDLSGDMRDVLKGLRKLRKSSAMAFEMLKVFSEEHDNSADIWNHKELSQQDCSINGEVLSLTSFKGKIFSGHSDGTIKVWKREGGELHVVQEMQEHTKAVTSLGVVHSTEKLYSGSLDRSVRVWSVTEDGIYCEQIEEMKDQINKLVVANSMACYIPQGGGIRVHSWNGSSKLVNQNKYVKCLALVQGKLYCGCNDNSIQEIDLATGTVGNIQTGSKKLLGKAHPINALQVDDGMLYAAGVPSFDHGANVKIWSSSNYSLIGSLASTLDVRTMAVSSELVYLGGKVGSIEVWCKKKHTRVETLQTNSTARILCMALDTNEDMLVLGTSDGTIQTWGLS